MKQPYIISIHSGKKILAAFWGKSWVEVVCTRRTWPGFVMSLSTVHEKKRWRVLQYVGGKAKDSLTSYLLPSFQDFGWGHETCVRTEKDVVSPSAS